MMGKHIQIGALVEKEHGLSAYNDISSSKGVLYAFLETEGQMICFLKSNLVNLAKRDPYNGG